MDFNKSIAYTISGSDSGGGAGLQADLKVFSAFKVHGCSVTTAITSQNTLGIQHVLQIPKEVILSQFDSLKTDLPPNVIKTGMLGDAIETVYEILKKISVPIICDPVLNSSSGTSLLTKEKLDFFKKNILPLTSILTPNLIESKILLERDDLTSEEMANAFLDLGVKSILIKGGHSKNDICSDFFNDGIKSFFMESQRIKTRSTHGTGCILSSAIAASIASKQKMDQAVITAKTYLNQALNNAEEIGNGFGPADFAPPCNEINYKPNII
ncbi:MAG: bifunctional hydroxymethylpyrimidine kinase/phosphomethylpyrimidine kinase [Pontiellaceae bacterium]